jgi:hypothetical protein
MPPSVGGLGSTSSAKSGTITTVAMTMTCATIEMAMV